ncbi:MAG: iron chelate uptake ABC transporter family permease subunit, partial [Butyrivibrio sp.]|nr:iron chelate uptake ABC transporter family permease subunit [Butyrivibrio sp.]
RLSFTLGGLSLATWRQLAVAVPVMLAGCILTLLLARGMDLFALGDETAHGLGLEVRRTRVLAICAATALASAAVGICGLISFVGLIVPNLLRIAGIRETRHAFAACFLYGGSFLLLCDVLARTIAWPYELPVGLLLSILGAPFFLWLLIRRGKRLGV